MRLLYFQGKKRGLLVTLRNANVFLLTQGHKQNQYGSIGNDIRAKLAVQSQLQCSGRCRSSQRHTMCRGPVDFFGMIDDFAEGEGLNAL
jgi:hypothetical protein